MNTLESATHRCECGCGLFTPLVRLPGHAMRQKLTPEQIFWQNVDRGEPDACWLWKGKTNHNGYGYFYAQSKLFSAHRFSYELHIGPIPKGKLVCHECDNRPCCNPKCFFAGTHLDNALDRVLKGRRMKTVTLNGVTKCASEWAKEIGISAETIRTRINRGWDAKRILAARRSG